MSRATERSVVPANILALPEFRFLVGSVVFLRWPGGHWPSLLVIKFTS
jgi:hypothetical protein